MAFGFMLYLQWEAMLISYLAQRVTVIPFDSIPKLVADTDFKISLMPGTSFEDVFKTATDPYWQKAWNDRIEPFLEDYRPYYGNSIKSHQVINLLLQRFFSLDDFTYIDIPMENPDIAMYDNYFSVV